MKIVLLGHPDLASLYALDLLMARLEEHECRVLLSAPITLPADAHPAMRDLDARDAQMAEAYLAAASDPALHRAETLDAPNSDAGVAALSAARPDLVVSIRYRRILKDAAIAVPPLGVLNLHSGLLPDYRGVMATFWALLADEREIGATLHRITDAGIDTGPVLGEVRRPADYARTYLDNVLSLYPPGCRRIAAAIDTLAHGETLAGTTQSRGAGAYFSAPDNAAVDAFLAKGLVLADGSELARIQGFEGY